MQEWDPSQTVEHQELERIAVSGWLWPSSRRQLFCASSTSLNTMASAVTFDRALGAQQRVYRGVVRDMVYAAVEK